MLGLFLLMANTLGERFEIVGVKIAVRMNSGLENMIQERRLEMRYRVYLI